MKPDFSTDYYGLLGCQPNASVEEIKKAFRKQAMVHHPDRNPGKEEEAKAKFQDMQAAYDCLNDPVKRTRYDQERLKRGSLWQKRASTSHAPPPNPFRQSQPPPRPQPKPAPGPSRYADYTRTSRDTGAFPDGSSKFQQWKAFENMKTANKPPNTFRPSPQKAKPAPTAQKARSRSDWDEGEDPGSPRTPRSQSTRVPRRGGFDPYAEEGDDTSSRNTSAFYNVSRGSKPQASYPRAENIFAQDAARRAANTDNPRSPGFDASGEDAYNSERLSTPYASKSGEKTYFSSSGLNRSASTAASMYNLNPERARPSPAAGRYRSASPRARSPLPDEEETSSSGSDAETYSDRMKANQQKFHPRPSGPKVTVQDEEDEPVFAQPRRQKTWDTDKNSPRTHYVFPESANMPATSRSPAGDNTARPTRPNLARDSTVPGSVPPGSVPRGAWSPAGTWKTPSQGPQANQSDAGNAKKPSLYEHYSFPYAQDSYMPKPVASQPPVGTAPRKQTNSTRVWPFWAIPSNVIPKKANNVDATEHVFEVDEISSMDANENENSSFSIPSSSSGSSSPLKNPSTENVDTQFSPKDWHGNFFSDASKTQPPQSSNRVFYARPRASPPKRPTPRTMHTSPPGTSQGLDSQSASQPTKAGSPLGESAQAQQAPSQSRFSPDEWNKHFKGATWAMPPPPPPVSRPISTPHSRSRSGKRNATTRKPTGTGDRSSLFVLVDDTGDEGDDEGRQSGSNIDTEPEMSRTASASAMDIDSNTPPASKMPSNGSVASSTPVPSTTTSPTPNYTNFPKPPPPATAFNMQPLTSTFPMAGSSSAGLSDLKNDLGTTLPFESGAASAKGAMPKAQVLTLPNPPRRPPAPGRLTNASCATYMNSMSTYMREFHSFNGRMLAHLQARQAAMEQMTQTNTIEAEKGFVPMVNGVAGGGFGSAAVGGVAGANLSETASWSWMGARGDEGYMKYMAWMEEDQRVREHYNVAWEKHKEALDELGAVRKQMKDLVARGMLN